MRFRVEVRIYGRTMCNGEQYTFREARNLASKLQKFCRLTLAPGEVCIVPV